MLGELQPQRAAAGRPHRRTEFSEAPSLRQRRLDIRRLPARGAAIGPGQVSGGGGCPSHGAGGIPAK